MKKLLLIIPILLCCSKNDSKNNTISKETILSKELGVYLNKTNLNNNLAEEKNATDASKVFLDVVQKENALADYPLFYETGMKADNNKSWVKFRTGFMDEEIEQIPNYKNYDRISFQILAKVDDKTAQSLKENKPYFLKGKMIEKGWNGSEGFYDFDYSYINDKLSFGNITYKITDIK